MTRSQLEHILRAAAAITGTDEFVIIGSQAILGSVAQPPPELVVSIEADLFTRHSAQDADLIDGSIGEAPPFHRAFGYYAHGVGVETAILPDGWEERLVPFQSANTGGAKGLCLDIHDLTVAKLAAGRPKDLDFVAALFRHRLATVEQTLSRLDCAPLDDQQRRLCVSRVRRLSIG